MKFDKVAKLALYIICNEIHRIVMPPGIEQHNSMMFKIVSYRFSTKHHIENSAFFTEMYPTVAAIISEYFEKWNALKVEMEKK